MNAKPLPDEQALIDDVNHWLTHEASHLPADEQAIFDQKWEALTSEDRMILKALIEEGGQSVKASSVKSRLRTHYGVEKNAASEIIRTRLGVLSQSTLVQRTSNTFDGDEISLHPTWQWYVRHEVRKL